MARLDRMPGPAGRSPLATAGQPPRRRLPLKPLLTVAVFAALAGGGGYAGYLVATDGLSFGTTAPRVLMQLPARGGPEEPAEALLAPPPPAAADAPSAPSAPSAPTPPTSEPAPAAATAAAPPDIPVPAVPDGPSGPVPGFAALPAAPPADPLPAAPGPGLAKPSPKGNLPVVAEDGRQPWTAYARPFAGPADRPRVAVLVAGLGLSREATEAAISRLPADVSLAFSPYADNLQEWVGKARTAGHEVLLGLPLEPLRYPARDPGPLALLTELQPGEVQDRILDVLGRATGYVGLVAAPGSAFAMSPQRMAPVMATLAERGLLYVGEPPFAAEAAPAAMPAFAAIAEIADEEPFRAAVDARLARVLAKARQAGAALAVVHPSPVALERLSAWIGGLEGEGVVLAPVTAVARTATSS